MFGGYFMSQALSEEEKKFVQRFDAPTIRDFDFPPESGNLVMPYITEPPEIFDTPISNPAELPAGMPTLPPELAVQPEKLEPLTSGLTTETIPQEPSSTSAPVQPLDPRLIPKFVSQLTKPPVFSPVSSSDDEYLYMIDISSFNQQMLPEGFPETTVWGYGGNVMDEETRQFRYAKSAPGPTFEAVRNMPVRVKWINMLNGPHLMAADPAFDQENAAGGTVPVVAHLHGANIASALNGHPDAWFTCDGKAGPKYSTPFNIYPNSQDAATLWYGDNAKGISQANVYAGLAGVYLLRSGVEFGWQRDGVLPRGRYEIPLIIQDRSFNSDGSLSFAYTGTRLFHRDSGFLGDTITVNGKVWPNLNVEKRLYRFRLLNASGTRSYNLRISNGMAFTQIGAGTGFLSEPKTVDSLRLAPGERADILVDFSSITPGTKILLLNEVNSPFQNNDASDPETTGQIMQFTVPIDVPEPAIPKKLPKRLKT
jgi:FtsP/CotA-like multicopper oxidase with cupredoxin domain